MKKELRKENAITLIALIITIIVLLILAGVSISMVVGDNGILTQAVNASTATDVADTKEQIQVALVGELDDNGDYTVKDVIDVAKEITGNDVDTSSKTVESANGNTVDLTDILAGAKASWWYDDDGNVTNGSATLAIGDYVDYDPGDYTYTSLSIVNGYADQVFNTSSYSYSWRVLGVDEDTGELLIISDDLIGPDSGGNEDYKDTYGRTYFYLSGQAGYANCESELNAICGIYGNGTGATGSRSINVDDINKITGYNPETAGYGSGKVYEYGNEVTYTKNSSTGYIDYQGTIYPIELTTQTLYRLFTYYSEDDKEWITLGSGEYVTLTSTSYYYYPNTLTTNSTGDTMGINTTSTEYYMLFENSERGAYKDGAYSSTGFNYWLSTPSVSCWTGDARFRCGIVTSGCVSCAILYYGFESSSVGSYGVRPMVYLSSDIFLSGSSSEGWSIVIE